ncbi:hypothetical protein [Mycobacterium camsae]|uniref:hypothetical protein n=1 Tax=Mycobacterium gordonae TaxID=1778 RepID=UPI0019811142|nr:hypothetical protein [Mycobacterium gordonae]
MIRPSRSPTNRNRRPERDERIDITGDPPTAFGDYSQAWLEQRPICGRTRAHYWGLLKKHILLAFATTTLRDISPDAVANWYAVTATSTPTTRVHAYSVLRTIMQDALACNMIDTSPCQDTGVGSAARIGDTLT